MMMQSRSYLFRFRLRFLIINTIISILAKQRLEMLLRFLYTKLSFLFTKKTTTGRMVYTNRFLWHNGESSKETRKCYDHSSNQHHLQLSLGRSHPDPAPRRQQHRYFSPDPAFDPNRHLFHHQNPFSSDPALSRYAPGTERNEKQQKQPLLLPVSHHIHRHPGGGWEIW